MLFMKRPTPQTRTQKACHGRPRVHSSICASLKKLAEFQKAVEGFLWVSAANRGGGLECGSLTAEQIEVAHHRSADLLHERLSGPLVADNADILNNPQKQQPQRK